jgi:V8-like Glu-specific endopeptidase
MWSVSAAEDIKMMSSVMKIKTYDYNSIDGTYSLSHYGSAVLIDNKRIITNAHVILDSNSNVPTGYYEICNSDKNKKVPTCFTVGKLLSYDIVADLAILELATPVSNIKWAIFSNDKQLSVGNSVVVYGYPSIGWMSITRTEWKIGWIDGRSYKFDGTIDHGNSGGGAFGSDGKLIGIPYAVKSDNGSIWYIIPVEQVIKFIWDKTDNIEKYTAKNSTNFISYIKNTQKLYKNQNTIKTQYVEIKNAEKSGFTLNNVVSSISWDTFLYYFSDINNRVDISASCTKDASMSWRDYVSYNQDYLLSQQKNNPKVVATGVFLDKEQNNYLVEILDTKSVKGDKKLIATLVNKKSPTCSIVISAQDGKNKDKSLYEKALTLAKTIKFTSVDSVKKNFNSPFFTINTIPDNVYLSQDFSVKSTIPFIGIKLPSWKMASSTFTLMKFDNLSDYMSLGSSENKEYKGTNFTFEEFSNRYKTTIYSNVYEATLYSDNNKPVMMTLTEYGEKTWLNTAFEKQLTFFYPFQTAEWEYRWYKFDFVLNSPDDADNFALRQVIESMILPGNSPFTK